MNSLLSKLHVRDRTQAATMALKRGRNDFNPPDADANGFFTDTNIANWSHHVVQPFASLIRLGPPAQVPQAIRESCPVTT